MKIILVRHAQTAWNRDNRIQGHMDSAVTLRGMQETQALIAALVDADCAVDEVHASPLPRAWVLGRALAMHFQCPLISEDDLKEQAFGKYEGLSFEALRFQYPNVAEALFTLDANFLPPEGESLVHAASRVIRVVQNLQKSFSDKTICLVSHGQVCQVVLALLKEGRIENFAQYAHPNGSYSIIDVSERGSITVRWGVATHLKNIV